MLTKTDNPNLKDYIFSYIENNDTEKMLTTFASKIYKASGSLLRAIKINIIKDLMLGDAIDIQRIDSSYHNYLNKLPTKFWNVNDSVIQTQETTPANLILNPIKEIDEWKLVHRTDRVVFPIWNNEIKINDGQPIDIGGSIFYLGLGIKSDGLNVNPWADYITLHDFDYSSSGPKNEHKTTRTVHTYEGGVDKWVENNHSDYPKIIHIVIPAKITSTSTVTDSTWDKWEIELDNVQLNYDELQEKLDGVSKLYYSTLPLPVWAESYIPIEIPNFNEHLREAIREAVTYTRNEFIKQDLYNPTSTYKITISIKNIDVKEVYFDKFSETQIKNLILKNISAALEIKIYEDEPVL